MTTTYEPPNKPGVCNTCDEPSNHLQESFCDGDGCGLSTGLLCEDCYRRHTDRREPDMCRPCARKEERAENARLDHLSGDNDRAYDAWKDGDR
jgi:hypothetical protein